MTLPGVMSIHSEIKRLRLAKGWSHQRLADEIAKVEGGTLSWQTVQQWEREPDAATGKSTAPKRKRLEIVAQLLGSTVAALMAGGGPQSFSDLHGPEAQLVMFYRQLDGAGQALLDLVAEIIGQPAARRLDAINAAKAVAANPALLAQLVGKGAGDGGPSRGHRASQGTAPKRTRKTTSPHTQR